MDDKDKELLRRAAKAAGIEIQRSRMDDPLFHDYLLVEQRDGRAIGWNPLTDDGDALRLAVKLQLVVSNEHVASGAVTVYTADESISVEERSGEHEPDVIPGDYAATRRAIVRAAAALGGEIKPELDDADR